MREALSWIEYCVLCKKAQQKTHSLVVFKWPESSRKVLAQVSQAQPLPMCLWECGPPEGKHQQCHSDNKCGENWLLLFYRVDIMLDNVQSFNIRGNRNWKKFAKGSSPITWHASWLGVICGLFESFNQMRKLSAFVVSEAGTGLGAEGKAPIIHPQPPPQVQLCPHAHPRTTLLSRVPSRPDERMEWWHGVQTDKATCGLSREMKMETITCGNQFMCSASCDCCVIPINKHPNPHVHTQYNDHLMSHPCALPPCFPLKKWSL